MKPNFTLIQALHDPTLMVGTVWHTKPGQTFRRMIVISPGVNRYGDQRVITRNVETMRLSYTTIGRVFSNYVYEGRAKNVH